MKAMILAAGLGTRLRPLTDNRPKALVEIAGRTMLEVTLARLRSYGIREVIVNVQGDLPFFPPAMVEDAVAALARSSVAVMSTVKTPIYESTE